MQNNPLRRAGHTFTVFRLAITFFLIGLAADLAGFVGIAGAVVISGLLIAVTLLSNLEVFRDSDLT